MQCMCIIFAAIHCLCRERLVQELKERVDHLEKQLREVTLQLDSSETKLEVSLDAINRGA